jgi:hypothetical protein
VIPEVLGEYEARECFGEAFIIRIDRAQVAPNSAFPWLIDAFRGGVFRELMETMPNRAAMAFRDLPVAVLDQVAQFVGHDIYRFWGDRQPRAESTDAPQAVAQRRINYLMEDSC